jgi:hypothetical protein
MSYQITKIDSNISQNPILKVNPIRGANYREQAAKFSQRFPIGSVLTVAEFDEFAISECGIDPPASTEKQSDGWLAYLQRRHMTKTNINKAATHPAMLESYGVKPFTISQRGSGQMEVVTPFSAATATGDSAVMHQMTTLLKTKQRKLKHLIQSVDYENLPVSEQTSVLMLAEHIEDFEERINSEVNKLDSRFNKVKSRIGMLLADGRITPQNGGVKGLISNEDLDIDSDPE